MRFPRLPVLAVAFAGGILMAGAGGGGALAALGWWSAAAIAALAARRAPVCAVAAAVLAGGGFSSWERAAARGAELALPASMSIDDRSPETLRGVVAGPIEDAAGRRRFRLVLEAPARARVWVTVRGLEPAVLPGDRVQVTGRLRNPGGYRVPGGFDPSGLFRSRDAQLSLGAEADEVVVLDPAAAASPWRWPARAQRRLSAAIGARGEGDAAAAARAMVVGDRVGLDESLAARFRAAGISHVLAVSGLHLAVAALFAFAALRRGFALIPPLSARVAPARLAALAAIPLAIAFTALTGARISTLRALLVVIVVLVGVATDRRGRVVDALGVAALLILAHRPSTLFDPAFQLSFVATATLALALGGRSRGEVTGGPLRRLGGRALRTFADLVRAAVWSGLATAPITALHFGEVATGGLIANLAAVPLTELVVVPLGLAGALLSQLAPAIGGVLVDASLAGAGAVVAIADAVAARAPVLRPFAPTPIELAAALLLWLSAIGTARRVGTARVRAAAAALAIGGIVGSHLWTVTLRPHRQRDLRVTFLDVGQGDGAVLELPDGQVWLIDVGGLPFVPFGDELDEAERVRLAAAPGRHAVLAYLRHRRIRRVDVVVVSHPHPDHYMGLYALLDAIEIGELWMARPHVEQPADVRYRALLAQLVLRGVRVWTPPLDVPMRAGEVTVTALAPRYVEPRRAAADPVLSVNDNSLVLRLDYAGRRLLFAGDVEEEAEELLVERYGDGLAVDLVKVGHHGSPTSSTPPFVAATSPGYAVISCGVANRFGFPSPEVVARWRGVGAEVLRTDTSGAISARVSRTGDLTVRRFRE